MIALVAVVLIFSIPIIAIITSHSEKQTKLKRDILKDELELERLKQENFLIETEKLKLEIQKMETDLTKDNHKIL
nr:MULTISPECIES: hypothetical protein [Bacillus]